MEEAAGTRYLNNNYSVDEAMIDSIKDESDEMILLEGVIKQIVGIDFDSEGTSAFTALRFYARDKDAYFTVSNLSDKGVQASLIDPNHLGMNHGVSASLKKACFIAILSHWSESEFSGVGNRNNTRA